MELLTQDHIKFYYNESRNGLKMGKINFDLTSFVSSYSREFVEILRSCLIENPAERAELSVALSRI